MNAAQVRTGSAIKDLFLEATQSRHVDFSMASSSSVFPSSKTTTTATLFGKRDNSSSLPKKKSSLEKFASSSSASSTCSLQNHQQTKSHQPTSAAKLTLILFEEVDEAWEMEFLSNMTASSDESGETGAPTAASSEKPSLFRSSSSSTSSTTTTSSSGIDNGFYAAMKTLMRSAKCAIVLTANRVPNAFEKLKCKVIPVAPPPHEQVITGYMLHSLHPLPPFFKTFIYRTHTPYIYHPPSRYPKQDESRESPPLVFKALLLFSCSMIVLSSPQPSSWGVSLPIFCCC